MRKGERCGLRRRREFLNFSVFLDVFGRSEKCAAGEKNCYFGCFWMFLDVFGRRVGPPRKTLYVRTCVDILLQIRYNNYVTIFYYA